VVNADDLAAWMDVCVARGAHKWYERDGKSWDSTIRPEHLAMKYAFYDKVHKPLAGFAKSCENVKVFCKTQQGVFKYTVRATVKSGHNDTSLGNGIINACFAYLTCIKFGLKASIIVTGDDLLIAVYGDFDLEALKKFEWTLGIEPVAAKFSSPADVSFVSGVWVSDGCKTAFVPKPGRLISRLWWTVNPPSKKNVSAYTRGVARSIKAACSSLPVVRVFLSKFDSDGSALATKNGMIYQESDNQLGPEIWEHFALRYGTSVMELKECEAWLESLPSRPLFLVHPVLDRLMEVDLADAPDRSECLIEFPGRHNTILS
jgi:hypothetical protein